MNKTETLAKACKELMLKEPFYGLFLLMLNKQWSTKTPTASVSLNGINYQLSLGEEFWSKLTSDQHKGILKHELLHIGFFHLTDYNHLSDHEIANIAMDIEINQYIDIEWLPTGEYAPQLPETYPELKLEPKKGTMYYYEKLMQGKKNGNCPNLNAMLGAMAAKQATCTMPDGGQNGVPDHSMWDELEKLDEATQKLIKVQTGHILKEAADQVVKSRGTIPGEFEEILKRLDELDPPKFDWKGYLRRFAGGSTKVYTKKTRRKFNKRYEDNPGLKIKQRKHILVAIDTSGSVSTNELKEFLQEIYHIHKTGAEITIVEADAAIRYIAKFDPKKDFEIHGRGGTDFEPVVEYYNENTHKYTCLIYLTDGEAPAPEKPRGRVLWVLSTTSTKTDHLPGPTIQLN
jgi:predicted metal-dependent peptidase